LIFIRNFIPVMGTRSSFRGGKAAGAWSRPLNYI